jgi:hypothetical protein
VIVVLLLFLLFVVLEVGLSVLSSVFLLVTVGCIAGCAFNYLQKHLRGWEMVRTDTVTCGLLDGVLSCCASAIGEIATASPRFIE